MSRRRAPLIAIKAKARLDLLARVISVAASLVFILSITNPILLRDPPAFALAEENNPGSKQPVTKARKKTKIDFQTIMAAARSAMALRTMASITRIKKKLSPQIKQNQARRRKSRRSNWRWARKASRKVSLWRTREIWTEQKARINPLMKTRWSGR